jgi:hypothetical protein
VTLRVPVSEIVAYYEPKTQDLLRRYGAGPRVCGQLGIFNRNQQFATHRYTVRL